MDAPVKKQTLREDLEQSIAEFERLLGLISNAEWNRPSMNPAWTVGQLAAHVAMGAGIIPGHVRGVRAGKNMNAPPLLLNPANRFFTWLSARNATPESVREKFDARMRVALALLDAVGEEEWGKSARRLGRQMTLEQAFRMLSEHTREHIRDIEPVLATRGDEPG